jgi:hypothetical protein
MHRRYCLEACTRSLANGEGEVPPIGESGKRSFYIAMGGRKVLNSMMRAHD